MDDCDTMPPLKTLEFEGLIFEVKYRPVKFARIEFESSIPVMVVPSGINPLDILREKKTTILRKHAKMIKQKNEARQLPLHQRSEMNFKILVSQYRKHFSNQLQVDCQVIKFRKMKRRWGSCRSDGRITLNRSLQYLPERLIAYIVFHELAHLVIRGHDKRFKAVVENRFPDHRILENELKLYGYRLLL